MKQEILEHEAERKQFYAAGCKLAEKYEEPGQAHEITYDEFKIVGTATRFNECTEELSGSSHSGLFGCSNGSGLCLAIGAEHDRLKL